jgi:hypothetical protein
MSTATEKNLKATGINSLMFNRVKDHERVAFEAYMAIYRNHGDHVILASPTIDGLSDIWDKNCDLPLNREIVQHVLIVNAD